MATYKKGNNKGMGFIFKMADGTTGWIHGLSKAEWNRMAREHGGKFVIYQPARGWEKPPKWELFYVCSKSEQMFDFRRKFCAYLSV